MGKLRHRGGIWGWIWEKRRRRGGIWGQNGGNAAQLGGLGSGLEQLRRRKLI